MSHISTEKLKLFIDLFISCQLSKWSFDEIKFTLFDHRRLSEMLVRLFPKEY